MRQRKRRSNTVQNAAEPRHLVIELLRGGAPGFTRSVVLLAFTASAAIGCGGEPLGVGEGTSRPGLIMATPAAPDIDAVFGFEATSSWSTTTAGATLGQSSTHSQGAYALSVRPSSSNGFTPIASVPLSTLSAVGPTLAVDVRLPTAQANPHWYGTFQIYLNCPSRAIYSQFLGQVELTGKPLNTWNTLTFALNGSLIASLLKGGYSDLVVTVVLNVQVPTTGVYLIDNLRFLPAAGNRCNGLPNGTACTDDNACTTGDTCQWNACRPGTAVTCVAKDQCHLAGTCDRGTGACSNPVKGNGAACDDGNVCTQGDSCQDGICSGSGSCGPAFVAAPSTVDFGTIPLNAIASHEITITNAGTEAGIPVLGVAGANATEFAVTPLQTDGCTPATSLAPGESCRAFAQLVPLTPGSKAGVITAGDTTLVTMSGEVPLGATFTATPSAIDFGTLPLTARGSRPVTVTNTGTVAGTPHFRLTGSTTADFAVMLLDEPGWCNQPVAPGATCEVYVRFLPLTSGNKSAQLRIGNAKVIDLVGVALEGGTFTATPESYDFGTLPLAGRSLLPITVTNTSTVTDTPVFSFEGETPQDFSIRLFDERPDSCSKPVAPGATCTAHVLFAPLTPGEKFVQLMLGNAPGMSLRGVVLEGGVFTATPEVHDFGTLPLTARGSSPITLTNTGTVTDTPAFSLDSETAEDFDVILYDHQPDSCGKPVAPGATCRAYVLFAPLTSGEKVARLMLGNAKATLLRGVALEGGTFTATPEMHDFGTLPLTARGTLPITVTNTSTVTDMPALWFDTETQRDFDILLYDDEADSCSKPVAPGATCRAHLLFAPETPGEKYARLMLGNAKATILRGVALEGGTFTAVPEMWDFGTLPLAARATLPITVTNTSAMTDEPVFWFDSETPLDFGIILNDDEADSCGKPVAPGATCRAHVLFAPLTSGEKYARLMLGNVDAIRLRAVALEGGTFTASPEGWSFGTIPLDGTGSKEIVVTNTSAVADTPTFWWDSATPSEFDVEVGSCGSPVAPGGTCSATVRLVPATPGGKYAFLMIGNTKAINLRGEVVSAPVP